MNRRDWIGVSVCALGLGSAAVAQAQISAAIAINRAARMRALSQRGTKAYAQWQLGVQPEVAQSVLAQVRSLVIAGQADLARAQLAADPARLLGELNGHAKAVLDGVAKAPTREAVVAVNGHASNMLQTADELTRAIERASNNASARLINLAGRQRMLSQRLAKNYFLGVMGASNPTMVTQSGNDQKDFTEALKTLNEAPLSTVGIRKDLEQMSALWKEYQAALAARPDQPNLRTMAVDSEKMLNVANDLTGRYEVVLLDLLGRV